MCIGLMSFFIFINVLKLCTIVNWKLNYVAIKISSRNLVLKLEMRNNRLCNIIVGMANKHKVILYYEIDKIVMNVKEIYTLLFFNVLKEVSYDLLSFKVFEEVNYDLLLGHF